MPVLQDRILTTGQWEVLANYCRELVESVKMQYLQMSNHFAVNSKCPKNHDKNSQDVANLEQYRAPRHYQSCRRF